MTTTPFEVGKKYHKFEIAGLGPAPYVLVDVVKNAFCAGPGATTQPGSSCDYCGTGIMYEYWLCAADGRRFKVGCDCVLKTSSDRALRVAVMNEKQKHERELRQAKAEAKRQKDVVRIQAAAARLPEVAESFRAQPHKPRRMTF